MSSPADVIKSQMKAFDEACQAQDIAKVLSFYHSDAVLVHKGKTSYYGTEAMEGMYKQMIEMCGKSTSKVENDTYTGTDDWIVANGKWVADTEKAGKMGGNFTQIWRKVGDSWKIYHDEFDMEN